MNKELEALEEIKRLYKWYTKYAYDAELDKEEIHSFAIIETALKEYEMMKQTKIIVADKKISDDDLEKLMNQGMLTDLQCEIKPLFDEETQKKLKALEIIKEKEVDMFIFLHSGDLETYNDMVEDNRKLTQEEFNLLREVLI